MPWKGKPTRVFAWIGMPKVEPGKAVPGIVLVHGGGGTAFDNWVRTWVGRGYAAIAMDTCGTVPRGSYGKWERHPDGGPPGNSFDASAAPAEDQWPYHAVADAILAHSLLRERPGVDPDRTGITGISWGGYLTCLVAGLDDRLKFAAPVYGCGFLGDNSVWLPTEIVRGSRAGWLATWDPSRYLRRAGCPSSGSPARTTSPIRWTRSGSRTRSPGAPRRCASACGCPTARPAGENPEEIRVFADSIVNGGPPLARFTTQSLDGAILTASFKPSSPVVKTKLIYTKDRGPWTERKWETAGATLGGDMAKATLPAGTTACFLNVEDGRGCVVSTRHVTIADAGPGAVPAQSR